jgi:ubiquinol-cytochrome c reductase cytochrome c subunit
VIAVALSALGTLYAALAPHSQAASAADPEVERGRQLFSTGCASCHGFNAEGGNRAPSLIGVGAAAVDFQVGTGRMPLQQHGPEAPRKKPRYAEQDIRALAAYVASLAPGPAIPGDLNYSDASIAEGGELFRTNCAQCHNAIGAGGALTGGKFAPSLKDATPKQIWEAMITGPESMPVFGDKVITPQEKLSIIKFVTTIRSEANPGGAGLGRVGPVTEGLLGWLVGIGALVGITLWIGARA